VRPLQRKVLREFVELRGQVLAIALVMIGGIATLVMSQTNYHALFDTREAYYREFRFADVFAQVKRAPLSLLAEVRAIPGVRQAEARVVAGVSLEIEDYTDPITGLLVSLPADAEAGAGLNRVFLRGGRLPHPYRSGEVVVGEAFAKAHALRPGDSLTAILNGRRQALEVVGVGLSPEFVYQIKPGDLVPDFERYGVLWMAHEPMAAAFDMTGAFNDVVLTLYRDAVPRDVLDRLDELLGPYGGIGAHGRDLQMSHRFLDEELGQLQVMTRLFSIIFLAVSAFLLNVVVGRLIATQREQIAVLKAFGYTRFEVARHYALLVLLMVSVGILPGLVIGAWLGRGLANLYMVFYSFPFLQWSLDPGVIAMGVLFALGAALIGTAAALNRVMRLKPAEAMRPEAPPSFRRALSERIGAGVLLDPPARMILRNLERRPLRSLMSILGIAMAGGILVMGRFQSAAVEHMIGLQFGFAQRDDLTVSFIEPVSPGALDDLAALPGVRLAEPFRHVGAILRNGHREYRTALQGLPEGADLRRVLDTKLQPHTPPRDGVMLTGYLADMLALKQGDQVEIEFLEGHRRTVFVPLAGTVQEYFGVGAYSDRRFVNQLLAEDEVISGAYLALNPGAREQVVAALRERPRVAGVTDRVAAIRSFRDTMAETMLTFTLVMTLLAGAIAVGVVYNAARLTLAERSRELASLRVLGYTRGEVKALLVGELMLLTFLALPLAFALGHGLCWLLVTVFTSDLYRIPLVISPSGFGFAGLLLLAAAALSALLVQRRLDRLDLVAVLKTRE
jgi:putative ABC transport system permease protein